MSVTKKGLTVEQNMAAMLTNEALADRLGRIAGDIRWCNPTERQAYLAEAGKRLLEAERLADFKAKVRDRAIKEADRRGWCTEFDDIIKQLGMVGRWAEFTVEYSYAGYDGVRRSNMTKLLARDADHAWTLVFNQARNRFGYERIELVSITKDGVLIR